MPFSLVFCLLPAGWSLTLDAEEGGWRWLVLQAGRLGFRCAETRAAFIAEGRKEGKRSYRYVCTCVYVAAGSGDERGYVGKLARIPRRRRSMIFGLEVAVVLDRAPSSSGDKITAGGEVL